LGSLLADLVSEEESAVERQPEELSV
jgi:hypothetical protein